MSDQFKTEHIGAKFSQAGAERIRIAANALGFKSPYALVQMLCDCIVRLKDLPQLMSDGEKRLIGAFDCLVSRRMATGITAQDDMFDVRKVTEAFYVVHKKGKDVEGQSIMHFKREVWEDQEMFPVEYIDYNANEICDRIFQLASPFRYNRMKKLMRSLKIETFNGLIDHLLNKYYDESLDETISEMFADNENSFTRRNSIPDPENHYKRIHHRDIENVTKTKEKENETDNRQLELF